MGFAIFLLGLCIGSFVNMAIWRIGEKKSFFKKQRSYCDFCGKKLKMIDNIPVLSWILLGGKSRCCHKKLPILYPVVELITGILFLINYQFSVLNFSSILNYLILALLVFEAAFDFKYMMLPDFTAYVLIGLAFIKWALMGAPVSYVIYALVSALFIFILHKIKIRGQEAMGDGDVLLAFFMGLFLGFPNVVVAFYMAFVVGAIVGGILMWRGKVKRLTPIPFGPFLILGTIVALWWGERIVEMI